MFNLINLEDVRQGMISEIQTDIDTGNLYISERLNSHGKEQYPAILLEAAKNMDINDFSRSLGMQYFNSHYQRRKPKGGFTQAKMPYNANVSLCEGEFNRFYIRAVCLKAIASGQRYVIAYRARPSSSPRYESISIEGKQFDAKLLLQDLQTNTGVDTALGLTTGTNSGMSVRL